MEECAIYPFLTEYTEQANILIYTVVTESKLYSGEVIILESLWIGNRVEKSLINPNQFQKFDIKVCDDRTDPHSKLVIESSEDLFILMATETSTFGILTHPTTEYELHECQWILLSDEFNWDQSNNLFKFSSM